MIQYIAEGVKLPTIEKQKINRWIKEVANDYSKKVGDIAYIFCYIYVFGVLCIIN